MILLALLCAASLGYAAAAIAGALRFARRPHAVHAGTPVTVLKPLAGLDPELFENLCSFCEQDHPCFQVIFGVSRADDPAIAVVRRVIERYPTCDLKLVVDERPRAGNPKVANLQGMIGAARHDLLVIADADMRVEPGYLSELSGDFADPRVGAATCLYEAAPMPGLASLLAALHVNDQFAPSVLVATLRDDPRYCFGATMALRRTVLDDIGGLDALAPHLADDYALGALATARGHRVLLSRRVVRDVLYEPGLRAMLAHELRWARTVRMSAPLGYAGSLLTYPLALAFIAVLVARGTGWSWVALGLALVARVAMHLSMRRVFRSMDVRSVLLLPLRDALGFAVWAAGFTGGRMRWRGASIDTDARGRFEG